jgi:hypothetical protein
MTSPRLAFPPIAVTPERRRIMPIEQALKWAYAEELAQIPSIGGEPEFHSSHPMWNMARVDGTSGGFDENALRRLASPDAVEIAKTVHRLADAATVLADEPELVGGLLDDGGPGLPQEHAAVTAAMQRVEVLVIVHARLGTAPALPDVRTPYAIRTANGEVCVRRLRPFKHQTVDGREVLEQAAETVHEIRSKPTRQRYPQGSYCLVGWSPDWPELLRERAEYLAWRLSLRWLARNLKHLERTQVLPSRLPLRPWQT